MISTTNPGKKAVARRDAEGLSDLVAVPHIPDGFTSVWAQYTMRLPDAIDRKKFIVALKAQGCRRRSTTTCRAPAGGIPGYPTIDGGLPMSEGLACLSSAAFLGDGKDVQRQNLGTIMPRALKWMPDRHFINGWVAACLRLVSNI